MRELKKRKETQCYNESDSIGSGWVSSSASAPTSKKKRQHYDGSSFSEEVGDSDYLQLPGRERFGQRSSAARERDMSQCFSPCKERECAIAGNGNVLTCKDNHVNVVEFKGQADGNPYVKGTEPPGREDLKLTLISSSAVRTFMETLIEELREARTHMLQWMRQEMHNMMLERPATPGAPTKSTRQMRGDQDWSQQKVVRLNGTAATTTSNLNICDARRQLERHSPVRSGHGFEGYSCDGVARAGMNSCDNTSGAGGTNYRMQAFGIMNKQIERPNDHTSGVKPAGQESANPDASFGIRSGGSDHTRETEIEVALFDCKTDSLTGLERRNEGSIGFSIHNDIAKSSQEQEFQMQNDLCGEMGFVLESGTVGGPGYGHSSNSGSVMNFGEHSKEFRVSSGPDNNSRSHTAGLGNHQGPSLRFLKDDNTPDILGLHCQAEVAELHDSVSLNVAWNILQQGGRNFNQGLTNNGVPNFNYDSSVKIRTGGDTAGGISANGIRFDNPSGMLRPSSLQNAMSHLSRQVSTPKANHYLYSSGMPALLNSQNQVPMHSPAGVQNFLGLNVGVTRQVIPDMHFQETGQQSIYSSYRAGMSASPNVSLIHKRGNGLLSLDMLELNT